MRWLARASPDQKSSGLTARKRNGNASRRRPFPGESLLCWIRKSIPAISTVASATNDVARTEHLTYICSQPNAKTPGRRTIGCRPKMATAGRARFSPAR